MEKTNLLGYTIPQLEAALVAVGEKPFRGRQLFRWLYHDRLYDFERMSNLSRGVRTELAGRFRVSGLTEERELLSRDGTRKYLFRLSDGRPIETVLIPDRVTRQTACISVQAGCAVKCAFCATGTMGLLRDLTVGEIVGQLLHLRDRHGADAFSNIVIMGMGEPLLNFEAVVDALRIVTHEEGLGVSPRKITLSTSGITPKILKLAGTGLNVKLAVSLHAATQKKRVPIMPIARTFSLPKLIDAARMYGMTTKTVVTFEYILFAGYNDSMVDVTAMAELVGDFPCKINVLAYNPVPGLDFERPSEEKLNWFGKKLSSAGLTVTIRKSRGRDIDAACGQLAARKPHMEKTA